MKAFSHERVRDGKSEWLTPLNLVHSLGKFDLDPCAAKEQPWATAENHLTLDDDGLVQDWKGRVWLNPPYGTEAKLWLAKLVSHGNGIALVFARTETKMFFDYVWPCATGIRFLKGRLTFLNVDGSQPKNSSGAPSCLIAYGEENFQALSKCSWAGKSIRLN